MPEVIKLSDLKPDEITIEPPETISLADLKPDEIKIEQEVRPRRSVEPVEAGLRGAAQGASLGFSDEMSGAANALVGSFKGEGKFSDLYKKFRDEARAQEDAAKADSPASYMSGLLGGSVALGFVPGANILLPARGAGIAANVGKAALAGGMTGLGTSEEKDVEGMAFDTATGAALGGVTQYGLDKAGQALKFLKPNSLKGYAEQQAVKAAGAMKKDFNILEQTGRLHETGRDLLDKKIVTAFGSLDDVANKAIALKKDAGKAIGSALSQVDDLVSSATKSIDEGKLFAFLPTEEAANKAGLANIPTKESAKKYLQDNFQFNMGNVAKRFREEIIQPNLNNPLLSKELNRVSDLADDFSKLGSQTLKSANMIKSAQGKMTRFASESVPEAFKKEIYSIINTEMENVVSKIGSLEQGIGLASVSSDDIIKGTLLTQVFDETKGKAATQAYKDAKKAYQTAITVEKMAKNRLGAVRSNRGFGLTDTIMASGGIASGNPVQGLALGGLNNLARRFGSGLKAKGADALADILSKAPNQLGAFGAQLERAATAGTNSLLATHAALMKDPNYKRILKDFEIEQRTKRLETVPEQPGLRLPVK